MPLMAKLLECKIGATFGKKMFEYLYEKVVAIFGNHPKLPYLATCRLHIKSCRIWQTCALCITSCHIWQLVHCISQVAIFGNLYITYHKLPVLATCTLHITSCHIWLLVHSTSQVAIFGNLYITYHKLPVLEVLFENLEKCHTLQPTTNNCHHIRQLLD